MVSGTSEMLGFSLMGESALESFKEMLGFSLMGESALESFKEI